MVFSLTGVGRAALAAHLAGLCWPTTRDHDRVRHYLIDRVSRQGILVSTLLVDVQTFPPSVRCTTLQYGSRPISGTIATTQASSRSAVGGRCSRQARDPTRV